MKYCLPLRSKLMSVSPPPGGASVPRSALGGGPGEMVRKVWPPSTEPNQTLRCVPVPVGPLTYTRPCGSIPMSGSPNVWIGSTTDGVSKPIDGGEAEGAACGEPCTNAADARTSATPNGAIECHRRIGKSLHARLGRAGSCMWRARARFLPRLEDGRPSASRHLYRRFTRRRDYPAA